MNASDLPESWARVLGPEFDKPYFKELTRFLAQERAAHNILPPPEQVFHAFSLTPFSKVRVLILGQDPYHGPGLAHGLAFSVPDGVAAPPSLANMFKELVTDLSCPAPATCSLAPWAGQGVMLLNAVLTVQQGAANSHQGKGWEKFTDAVISALSARAEPLVFVLWGGYARKKAKLIDKGRHRLLEGIHPSPLSAYQGFFGSKPYSKINALLKELGQPPIDWRLPDATPTAAPAPLVKKGTKAPEKTARARPEPAPHPAVLVLGAALREGQTPPPAELAQALRLATWDALTAAERRTVAEAAERVLPAGFTLAGLELHQSGATRHEVAIYLHEQVRYALIPGGDVRLGWARTALRLSEDERQQWWKAQRGPRGAKDLDDPEEWAARYLTPARTVRVDPFLLEVAPKLRGADLLSRGGPGLGAHGQVLTALCAAGLRLPTADEWEHAISAGARTLFPWGDTWPTGAADEARPWEQPLSLGLVLGDPGAPEATLDPDLFRGGDGGGLAEAGRAPPLPLLAGLMRASSFQWDLRAQGIEVRWESLLRAAPLRRTRPIFPYAKRS